MKLKSKFFQIGVCSTVALAMCDVLAAKEPLYEGLGSYSRKVTTDSAEAQRYFDQGLAFLHGFNHRAAIRAFQQAAELDPECAMAHWGVALACGPHINLIAVPPPAAELAWKELDLAQKNAANAQSLLRNGSGTCSPASVTTFTCHRTSTFGPVAGRRPWTRTSTRWLRISV